jgi:exopolyphosphatase/guanosine-5'-triphosphate,3'-diphosphate pyrophosphatase
MPQRIAIIDMGTNTFHLLIAEACEDDRYEIVYRDRVPVKIGKGGINNDYITEEGLERAVVAMDRFNNTINEFGAKKIYAFGTSALRNAKNSYEVLEKIQAKTGIEVSIISGETEAEYIYKGVRHSLEMGGENSLIVDIGGGSVECIIGNNTSILWKESYEIGAQRLLERFHKHDPITHEEIEVLNQHFEDKLTPLFKALCKYPTRVLIGASGTFDTLSEIYCHQNKIEISENRPETPLTIESFYSIYDQLITKNRAERMQIPGMIEMRVDMIVVACCLVRYILSKNSFRRLRVSSYSLKEGVLAALMEREITTAQR